MVSFPFENDNDVVATVHQSNVSLYNLKTRRSECIVRDLGFSPTAMAAGRGYLAVGGQRSQLAVRQFGDEDYQAQTTVGGAINNALHICEHLGETRLLVCNNDETIKIFRLPSMEHIGDIRTSSAVNSVCQSPDGRFLVAAGDSGEVVLYGVSASQGYVPLATSIIADAGFSCSWDSVSARFAVAGQEGSVGIWDVRMQSTSKACKGKIASIDSAQKAPKGAVRCVKFSQDMSMDILAFTEHTSFLNLVDARNLRERQRVRLLQPGTDLNITGKIGG